MALGQLLALTVDYQWANNPQYRDPSLITKDFTAILVIFVSLGLPQPIGGAFIGGGATIRDNMVIVGMFVCFDCLGLKIREMDPGLMQMSW